MDPRRLRIADITYELPQERIAQHPLADRDAAKLLVYRDGRIIDDRFGALAEHLPEGSLLVFNDTRVVKARIIFYRNTGARIECMVLEPEPVRPLEEALADRGRSSWWCMVGNAARWAAAGTLMAGEGPAILRATRMEQREGTHLVEFSWDDCASFSDKLTDFGHVPLPPYMKRPDNADDPVRYNTVFAENDGSVAAPTASLHLTPALLDAIAARGIGMTRVTLHVGAGTFLPVKAETMDGHSMHTEQVRIPRTTVERLRDQARRAPIVPVGTTALRTIESLCWFGDDLLSGADPDELAIAQWRPYGTPPADTPAALEAVLRWMDGRGLDTVSGRTALLIAPGYPFRLADALVTNFHQPGSTLLLLVEAFIGPGRQAVYDHALRHGYRFLSYGDGSLLWRTSSSGEQ